MLGKNLLYAYKQSFLKYEVENRIPEPSNVMDIISADKQYNLSGEDGSLAIMYEILLSKLSIVVQKDREMVGLDIACGSGQLICKIAKEFDKIKFTSFDFSEQMLKLANENKKKYEVENLDFIKADMNKLLTEFRGRKFDLIIWSYAMHHTNTKDEVINIINSSLELLNEDGVLFIFDFERLKTKKLAKEFGEEYNLPFGYEHFLDGYNSALAAYSFDEVEEILKQSNWNNYKHIHPFFGNFYQIIYTDKKLLKNKYKPKLKSFKNKFNYYFLRCFI